MMKKIWNSKVFLFFRDSPKAAVGAGLILIVLIFTPGAGLFTPYDPTFRYVGEYHSSPSAEHILGTT